MISLDIDLNPFVYSFQYLEALILFKKALRIEGSLIHLEKQLQNVRLIPIRYESTFENKTYNFVTHQK